MVQACKALGKIARQFLLLTSVTWMTACATTQVAMPTEVETLPEAITIPYRISTVGHLVVDIAVNGHAALPFIFDTGANTSSIYENSTQSLGLAPNGQSVLVRGLVAIGLRPTIEDVEFQIGPQSFPLELIAVLETPAVNDGTVGVLGADALSDYIVVFNREAMTATFVQSKYAHSSFFAGWRRIRLRSRIGTHPDNGLHFAQTILKDKKVPVLIDTGSNLNIINWRLATLDEDMRRTRRRLLRQQQLQGALETAPLRIETLFYGLVLGHHYWPESTVTIMDLDTLSKIAPVDEPIMIAGAGMLTPWTFAFDFGGDMLYIRAGPDDPPPPDHGLIKQSRFAPQSNGEEAS